MSALDTQIGGSHYKNLAIQPMEYSMANGLDACQHSVVKYVTRFRDKGGIADLEKAKHCIDMLIDFERRKEGMQELCTKLKASEPKHRGWPYLPDPKEDLEGEAVYVRREI